MPPLHRPFFTAWIFLLITFRLTMPPLIAAALLATLLWAVGLLHLPTIVWVGGFPLVYMAWLYVYLLICCVETLVVDSFVRKPETCTRRSTTLSIMSLVILSQYGRSILIRSLPYTQLMVAANLLRNLVLRAYSPTSHLSPTCQLSTILSDPDCTYIGDGTIIGGNVELVAHSFVRQLDGSSIYKSAPIQVGKNVTIGGNARIELGVIVGDGAIIEPSSHVGPFIKIGEGEVWGGNPAVFIRRREGGSSASPNPVDHKTDAVTLEVVLSMLARALNISPEKLTAETKMDEVLEWDSLGKIAIAAALHDQFGLELEPGQIFELDSVPHVLSVLDPQKRLCTSDKIKNEEEALPRDMELLPLCDPAVVTVALANRALPEASKNLRLCIAATTVVEPVAPTLQLWCRAFGVKADIVFAGFNQVHACLLDPGSIFFQNRTGLNVVLVCGEDLTGSSEGDLTIRARQLLEAIASFTHKSTQLLWVSDLPPLLKPDFATTVNEFNSVRRMWNESLASNPQVRILPFAAVIEELGLRASANIVGVTNTRYSASVYQRLAVEISRATRVFIRPPRKVLALDADDTLWEGIVAEDGPDKVKIGPMQRQLQKHAKAFKEKGGLLVMLSRNEPDDVWAVWQHQKDMLLRMDDFAAVRINWKAKSDNLLEIAAELNLGLDSFVFVDDNPGERIDVEAHCPGVLTIPAPIPGPSADALGKLWCFDRLVITGEDMKRTTMIQQESQRHEATQGHEGDYDKYLQTLELKVTIRRASVDDLPRVAQLTQKTNQFNASLRRRTQGELEQLESENDIWTISASDRFGDYGMIGVGILSRELTSSRKVTMDSFLLSCRALGRGIELASLSVFCEAAVRLGARSFQIPYVVGPRNQPILNFLELHGWKVVGSNMMELNLPTKLTIPAHIYLTEAHHTFDRLRALPDSFEK